VCEDELRLSLKLGKPVAILSKQQDVAVLEDFLKTRGEECPSVVHIYDKTAFGEVDGRFCWVLSGIETPASEMIAVTPKNFLLGQEEMCEVVSLAKGRGTAPQAPVFTVLDGKTQKEEVSILCTPTPLRLSLTSC
jgi:hypothetical protein